MPHFRVTCKFQRENMVVKGRIEDSERQLEREFLNEKEAIAAMKKSMKENEPTRRKIYSIKAELLG